MDAKAIGIRKRAQERGTGKGLKNWDPAQIPQGLKGNLTHEGMGETPQGESQRQGS